MATEMTEVFPGRPNLTGTLAGSEERSLILKDMSTSCLSASAHSGRSIRSERTSAKGVFTAAARST
jgi:hypothetical protein